MTQAKGRASKRKKHGRQKRGFATYVVAITDWSWDFFFGVNENQKLSSDPYYDYRHLKIFGTVVSPAIYKGRKAELTFLPDKRLNQENRQLHEPPHVGTITSERGGLSGLLSIPQDVVGELLQMLDSERYHWIVFNGERMRYRNALIRGFHFQKTFTEDDLSADE